MSADFEIPSPTRPRKPAVRRRSPAPRLAFSPTELQEAIGISRTSAYELARRIGVKLGSRWIVPRARLDEWLAGGGDHDGLK